MDGCHRGRDVRFGRSVEGAQINWLRRRHKHRLYLKMTVACFIDLLNFCPVPMYLISGLECSKTRPALRGRKAPNPAKDSIAGAKARTFFRVHVTQNEGSQR